MDGRRREPARTTNQTSIDCTPRRPLLAAALGAAAAGPPPIKFGVLLSLAGDDLTWDNRCQMAEPSAQNRRSMQPRRGLSNSGTAAFGGGNGTPRPFPPGYLNGSRVATTRADSTVWIK